MAKPPWPRQGIDVIRRFRKLALVRWRVSSRIQAYLQWFTNYNTAAPAGRPDRYDLEKLYSPSFSFDAVWCSSMSMKQASAVLHLTVKTKRDGHNSTTSILEETGRKFIFEISLNLEIDSDQPARST